MSKNLRENSLPSQIFHTLLKATDAYLSIMSNPRGVFVAGGVDEFYTMIHRKKIKELGEQRRQIRQAIQRLEQQRYMKIKQFGDNLHFQLCHKGVEEVLKRAFYTKEEVLPKGEYCYVSFDIPNNVKGLRATFRQMLKRADFTMIHLSLWHTNRDVAFELSELIKKLKAEKWIHVFLGRSYTRTDTQSKSKKEKQIQKKTKQLHKTHL